MKIERDTLEKNIDKVLTEIYKKNNNALSDEFCHNMLNKHNVEIGSSMDIIGKNVDLRELSAKYLLWITKELGVVVSRHSELSRFEKDLNLAKYFTDDEIARDSNSKLELENGSKFPIVFKDVSQVGVDQWVGVSSYKFIQSLRNKQIINYNQNTQRELTPKYVGGQLKFIITIIKKALKEITDKMLNGSFIPNAITFNINAEAPAEFEYDEEERTLTIYNATIDIIDGFHRYIAMTNAMDIDPELNKNTIVNIMYFDEDKAKSFIVQEDKKNKIKKSKITSLDVNNNSSNIVNYLNENSKSDIRTCIGTANGSLIDFGLMSDLVNYNFTIKSVNDVVKVKKYLLNAFNALIEDDSTLNSYEYKHHKLVWVFYIRLMALHFENNDINTLRSDVQKIKDLEFDKMGIKVNKVGKVLYNKVDEILREKNIYV